MDYTERMKQLRKECNYTQKYIADYLGVLESTYADIENGKAEVYVDDVVKLAKLYDVDMNYMCGVSDVRNEFLKE